MIAVVILITIASINNHTEAVIAAEILITTYQQNHIEAVIAAVIFNNNRIEALIAAVISITIISR